MLNEKLSEEEEKFYENAATKELYSLTVNGDDNACAYYIRRRIEEDTLTVADMTYLDASAKNLCYEAALVGAMLYGMKHGIYKDTEKEYFCYAVLEQYGDFLAHRHMKKSYQKNAELAWETDRNILYTRLAKYLTSVIGRYTAFTAEVTCKSRGIFGQALSYTLQLRFTEKNGRETDSDAVYTAFLRGKKKDAALNRFCNLFSELLPELAEKAGIRSGDIYIDGAHRFHWGDTTHKNKNNSKDRVNIVSDAKVNISISDEGRLKSMTCPFCGGTLDEHGVCSACGETFTKEDDEKIIIRRGRTVEALICTQCGSPVELDKNGKTAYCSACGTTFAVNGNTLTDGIYGLNYESIRADMPEGAVFPEIKFVRASIVENKVTAIMPENFSVMSDKIRRIKYPANAPKFIYTNPDATVNLTMNLLGRLSEDQVFAFGQQMLASLKASFPAAIFDEAKQITSPQNIFFVDFITAAVDQSIYNIMFFFSLNGRQGIGSWNCLGKDRWFWAPVFEHAIRTMEFHP